MGDMAQLFETKNMVLIASLPRNDPALARAAAAGGAHALKVHLNVSHAASGTHFGSWDQERAAITEILGIARAAGALVGIMPGTDQACATVPELRELAALGVCFMDIYESHLPGPAFLTVPGLDPMLAAGPGFTDALLDTLNADPRVALLEASVMPHEQYGQPLTPDDLDLYRNICRRFTRPVTVPTQNKIDPAQAADLRAAGVRGLMIGAIVAGKDPASFEQATAAFRRALDAV